MTEIIVTYGKQLQGQSLCSSIELRGHSGFDVYGKDIVCSAISTASLTTVNLIDKINSNCMKLETKAGYLYMSLDYQNLTEEQIYYVDLAVKNLIDVYKEISSQYPKNLKIKIN